MAATFTFYESFRERLADGGHDLDNDTFKVMLTSSSYTPSASSHAQKSDVTNELSTANGYTAGGAPIGSVTWTKSGATVTFDGADTVWTASGGSITARYAVIYNDTHASDLLVAYILLDNTPADVTATDGNTFTLQWHGSGVFTLS